MAYSNRSLKFSIKKRKHIQDEKNEEEIVMDLRQLNGYALVTVYVCQTLYDQLFGINRSHE